MLWSITADSSAGYEALGCNWDMRLLRLDQLKERWLYFIQMGRWIESKGCLAPVSKCEHVEILKEFLIFKIARSLHFNTSSPILDDIRASKQSYINILGSNIQHFKQELWRIIQSEFARRACNVVGFGAAKHRELAAAKLTGSSVWAARANELRL